MCSICASIDFKNTPNNTLTEQMSFCMQHRGPDASGNFNSKHISLAHNRLAVIDPENGAQPMQITYRGKLYSIVYNGELYNTDDIKKELLDYGVEFKTNCDTEVVLYSYIIFGTDCASHLNGIFAFVIYDEVKELAFIARDRFGVKPLFYAFNHDCMLVASEIKALLKHPAISRKVDKYGLWQLLYLSPVTINGSSIFKDISELEPATFAIFNKKGLKKKKYWTLEAREFFDSPKEAIYHTNELLCDAISRQLVSDVPLCCLLSGGIDSSIVSAVASKLYREKGDTLCTYSFEYEGNKQSFKSSLFQPQGDDEFAVYMSRFISSEHTILTAPTSAVAGLLFNAVDARDFPGQADIDSSLLYFCSEIKKCHTVALSGECADEIFGGYPWFYRPNMLLRDFFPWIHEPQLRISLFNDSVAKKDEGYEYISDIYKKSLKECSVLDTDSSRMKASRLATNLSVNYFMTSLLERKDRMSMASAVEVRVPFADHRILEYVYNIPWDIKFENNVEKALLRNAMKDFLPQKIYTRKKSPYPKTHNPEYEKKVYEMLTERLNKNSPLSDIIDKKILSAVLKEESHTWFGQLMSKPQLIAWLLQFDYWLDKYCIELI